MADIVIRVATFEDIEALQSLEERCFPQEHYPRFFFVQAREIFTNTLLLAEDTGRRIIGYVLGAPDAKNPSQAWILSMAVEPNRRRQGVGTAMLKAVENALQYDGVRKVQLSVDERNMEAVALYRKLGFKDERIERKYFGQTEPRIIMSKTLFSSGSIPPTCLNPDHLLNEASISVAFSSVLFAVSAAILTLLVTRSDISTFVTSILLLCLTIFSSFYSVIFYANASGSLSRIHEIASVTKPLCYGNSVSEYLGVYPLVCAFPLVVWGVTKDPAVTIIACTVDVAGFCFYQITGFDLLSRVVENRVMQMVITACLVLLIVLALAFAMKDYKVLQYVVIGLFLCTCFFLCIMGTIRNEKRKI